MEGQNVLAKRAWRYHKEYAPKGQIFDLEKVDDKLLEEEGWVDNPAKIGVNVWGAGKGLDDAVQHISHEFEEGRIKARDDNEAPVLPSVENERMAKERDALYERIRTQEDANENLKRELKESNEKLADHRSDLQKIKEKSVGETNAKIAEANKRAEEAGSPGRGRGVAPAA